MAMASSQVVTGTMNWPAEITSSTGYVPSREDPSDAINLGPFKNFENCNHCYSSTEYAPDPNNLWSEGFGDGIIKPGRMSKGTDSQHHVGWVWPVRSGGFAVVPEPATIWLLGLSFGFLGWMRCKAG